jgi:hypothetical protein
VCAHLGVETQRQWSDVAMVRTTPALCALFSLVTAFAHQWLDAQPFPVRQAAWYAKALLTFADALALVRTQFCPASSSFGSPGENDTIDLPRSLRASCGAAEAWRTWPRCGESLPE